MGIQIRGDTDTISAVDGSLVITGITSSSISVSAGSTSAPSISPSGDSNTGIFFPSADTIAFAEGGTEVARIDSSARLLVGATSFSSDGTIVAKGSSAGAATQSMLILQRGSSLPAADAVLGEIKFTDGDASGRIGALLSTEVDGSTWTASSYPTRLVFKTTANGASSPTERMRINSSGYAKFANDGSPTNTGLSFHGFDNSGADSTLYVNQKNTSFASAVIAVYAQRSASSAYNLATFSSTHVPGSSADIEQSLRGDGQAYADGSWNGGGADYAEYFEWSDCNADAEDRRGISVVLDGDKIREAVAGEDPVGVISGNPSVVGDAAWNKWSGKYLRDEFGTYIQEDYEVEDEDGNTVVQQRRKLNPVYNPDQEYISREQRPEWDCVGLMGKLRIRKGQVTGDRWIKMRDVSANVEEWLVR